MACAGQDRCVASPRHGGVVIGIACSPYWCDRQTISERFESKVVTVQPVGADGVRIREVVDEDFGGEDRHGYERIIHTDFGRPIDIEASVARCQCRRHVTP